MTDREKLYELMDAARAYADLECDKRDGCSCCPNDSRGEFCLTPWMVDYFIANGVVVREKGEWVETKNGFHCSRCKRKPGQHPTKRGVFLSDFCPNCGADMRKGENG